MQAKKSNFQFEDVLEKHHLKKTSSRLRVLSMLASKQVATSQADLLAVMGDVTRGALYRILSDLEEKGIIHKVYDLTGTANFALCHSNCEENHHHDEHLHFNCVNCNNVYCLDDLDLPHINLPQGFSNINFTLSATGICPSCNKKLKDQ